MVERPVTKLINVFLFTSPIVIMEFSSIIPVKWRSKSVAKRLVASVSASLEALWNILLYTVKRHLRLVQYIQNYLNVH